MLWDYTTQQSSSSAIPCTIYNYYITDMAHNDLKTQGSYGASVEVCITEHDEP